MFLFFSMLLLCSFFRSKELFQVKNGLTTSFPFFFWKMPKIWVGRKTLNGEKNEDGLRKLSRKKILKVRLNVFTSEDLITGKTIVKKKKFSKYA